MASLSHDDVRHIAKLARLSLSDAEVTLFSKELTSILDYVEKLKEVDTAGVEPTAQVTGLAGVTREDVINGVGTNPDDLLATSPLPIVDRQIETYSAHG